MQIPPLLMLWHPWLPSLHAWGVGISVGDTDGCPDGLLLGESVGDDVVGLSVGGALGEAEGTVEGGTLGEIVGDDVVGTVVGAALGEEVGMPLGEMLGLLEGLREGR
eukprot:Hpha_TRINITY_DN15926_c1_g3::TRINITY_DN15926_c1_g3_i1::g.75064::m.75064